MVTSVAVALHKLSEHADNCLMISGIRKKLLLLLLLVLVPISASSMYALRLIEASIVERIEKDLSTIRRQEVTRINHTLDQYRHVVESLTTNETFRAKVSRTREIMQLPGKRLQKYTAFEISNGNGNNAQPRLPYNVLAHELITSAKDGGAYLNELKFFDKQGRVVGKTENFSWEPYDKSIVESAISVATMKFGNAFRNPMGVDQLGVAVPLFDEKGKIVGGILMELSLMPLVDLLTVHEGYGDTSEAYLVQKNSHNEAEHVVQLRFNRDAAFTAAANQGETSPSWQSLNAFAGTTMYGTDYRGKEVVFSVQAISQTGWGVIAKIDKKEALAPSRKLAKNILLSVGFTVVIFLLGWFTFLNPTGKRLQRAAMNADRIATGDYDNPINDTKDDEIGDMSRSIDTLASELKQEFALRSEIEERLRHQANHDELTGLANRQRGNDIIESLQGYHEPVTVFFLDLDGFKGVNDVFGHNAGDEVLVKVAQTLQQSVKDNAVVARWGGDEFVIIEKGVDAVQAEALKKDYQDLFDGQITTSFGTHNVGCSIGNASCEVGESLEAALAAADELMYERKQKRKSDKRSLSISHTLVESALAEDGVQAWYQAIVDRHTQEIVGAEVLSRIVLQNGSVKQPEEYLPQIRGSDLAADYDMVVIRNSIETMGQWIEKRLIKMDSYICVNIMAPLVADPNLPGFLEKTLLDNSLAPHNLVVEVNSDFEHLDLSVLENLKSRGVSIAIDNINLRNSHIETILSTKADFIKIKPFTAAGDLDTVMHENVIMQTLMQISDETGIKVVLTGVESQQHHDSLKSINAQYMQGFFIDATSPADAFIRRWGNEVSKEKLPHLKRVI